MYFKCIATRGRHLIPRINEGRCSLYSNKIDQSGIYSSRINIMIIIKVGNRSIVTLQINHSLISFGNIYIIRKCGEIHIKITNYMYKIINTAY